VALVLRQAIKLAVLAIRQTSARHRATMVATPLTLLILHRQTETHTLVVVAVDQAALVLQGLRQM
jgi:hypothetical protein